MTLRSTTYQQHILRVALLALLLVAFALRAYHLDGQSFWSDEGISLLRSQRTLPDLLATMPVEQMPGYFVLLYGWLRVAGVSDFALRYLSLWPSVLASALTYRLAASLGSRKAGLFGVALLATSAFQIWYAQEARTYSWLLAAGLLSHLLFWRLLTDSAQSRRRVAVDVFGYGVATAFLVYLHYYGALVPITHTIFAIIWSSYRCDWRFLRRWTLGGIVSLLCFLPWLGKVSAIFTFSGWREAIDPWQIPWQVLTRYTISETYIGPWQRWLPWLYLGLIVLGLVGWQRRGWRVLFFIATAVLIPLLVTFGMALRTEDFHERYTMVVTAPLLLMVSGVAILPWAGAANAFWLRTMRWTAQIAVAALWVLLLVVNLQAVQQLYTNEAFHKPDFRAAVEMIERLGQPGDIVFIDGPDPNLVFYHYYQAAYPVHDLRPLLQASSEETFAQVETLTQGAMRVWELLFFHEPYRVQEWLARNSWSSPAHDYNGIRLTLYGLDDSGLQQTAVMLAVGESLLLTAVQTPAAPVLPGQLLQVSTIWQVVAPPPDYKFSLRLVDGAGQVVSAQDYVPQNWFAATVQWPVDGTVIDRRAFLLPVDLSPGTYGVTLRLYDPSTGAVAESVAGQDIPLGTVVILE